MKKRKPAKLTEELLLNAPRRTDWLIGFGHHPWIHEEDAKAAVLARIKQSIERRIKGRKRIPENVENDVLEKLFVASLVNDRPWTERQSAEVTRMLKQLSANKNSIEGLLRAFEKGKPPTWKKIDRTILCNWREIHLRPDIQVVVEAQEKLPGLQDWSSKTVESFFAWSNIETGCKRGDFDDWFRKRCMRLGLKGNAPYQIKEFIVSDSTVRIVR